MLTPERIIAEHLPVARRQLLETAVLLDAYAESMKRHEGVVSRTVKEEMRRFQEALELLGRSAASGRLEDTLCDHFFRRRSEDARRRAPRRVVTRRHSIEAGRDAPGKNFFHAK